MQKSTILGIDIGSIAVSIVELDLQRRIVGSSYAMHHGRIHQTLKSLLKSEQFSRVGWMASTSSIDVPLTTTAGFDNQIAYVNAAKFLHAGLRSLLIVGAEKFSLVRLDRRGNYAGGRSNSSCAAGTGSFLDQQAERLGLRDCTALSKLAKQAQGETPQIATRCSVFAKTDLIHAQQEGHTLAAICNGLCKGVATNVADIILGDEKPAGPVALAGGVALNPSVAKASESGSRL